MLHSTDYKELANGKGYQTYNERIVSHHGSAEEIANRSSSENIEGESLEFQTLTQEAVNEQTAGFIATLTRLKCMKYAAPAGCSWTADFSTEGETESHMEKNRLSLLDVSSLQQMDHKSRVNSLSKS